MVHRCLLSSRIPKYYSLKEHPSFQLKLIGNIPGNAFFVVIQLNSKGFILIEIVVNALKVLILHLIIFRQREINMKFIALINITGSPSLYHLIMLIIYLFFHIFIRNSQTEQKMPKPWQYLFINMRNVLSF